MLIRKLFRTAWRYKAQFLSMTLMAVSYTHLDVYKRQVITLSNRSPEGSIPRSADMLVTIINSASTSLVAKTRKPAKSKTDSVPPISR